MNNKVYIAGRITGDPHYRAKFRSASATVKDWHFFDRHGIKAAIVGYFNFEPVNPTECRLVGLDLSHYRWHIAMIVCLWHLLRCSYVYMLADWQQSRGARLEHKVAKFLGKIIIYQSND